MRSLAWIAVVAVSTALVGLPHSPVSRSGEESVEDVLDKYEAEVGAAIVPIRKRYWSRLESLKVDLARKGDIDGAKVAADAAAWIVAESGPSRWSRFSGDWVVQYLNGVVHKYEVAADGKVKYVEDNRDLRLERRGPDTIVDFGEGKIARWRSTLSTEFFYDGTYPAGKPKMSGVGSRQER